ncbi:DUF3110 domain-containing protein [Calothrix sp. FACHB-1219]|uniref:DUF3110 domain-containing protein n=1 Tax=unclassified Calothrix TaxID=2619626 RepID=UPI001689501A|nr:MULTISPECIES: DUF3110 domain-containing protein [unclassified Calothrix]MBD2204524.1 DUF3110 domain-containing protein [Calothrix sp. FACHB-168]MBD2219322.1 DUF3110 domain-containing protein [Calothrix sp. FACHB-1219]
MRVFVLIFNAGTENEGIHTVRLGDRNKILMFESEDDATRYALMLEAQDFPVPSVEAIDAEEIKEFCASANYEWEILTANSNELVTPPELNVEETDWKPEGEPEIPEPSRSNTTEDTEPDFSDSELEKIRRKLEGLL